MLIRSKKTSISVPSASSWEIKRTVDDICVALFHARRPAAGSPEVLVVFAV